jgi:hypothetical protein
MAGGAQDDDFFLASSQWWIVGLYTTPRSIFKAPAIGVSPMALSTRALERNGRGGPIGGGRGHGWRRPG